jgi:hypothetical protein
MNKGRSAEAYAVGKANPDELGKPEFDFYFGIAAIDSGHAGEGVLALERYIANFPGNLNARLELARGYFVLGDDARAREEFDVVIKTNPPPNVEANIQRFLDAIRSRESRYRTSAGFYAEIGYGWDSNVNGGVGSPDINLPIFGNVTITGTGVETADSFLHLALGGNVSHPIHPGVALFGAANAEFKKNRNDDPFDQANIGAAGGVTYLQEKNLYRATLSQNLLQVENNRFRTVTGLSGEVHHQLDELQTVNGFVQYAELDYAGANSIRDAHFYAAGAGYRRAFIGAYQPLLTVGVNLGEEDNRRGRPDLGRDLYGARVALALTPAPRWTLSAGASYQHSKYQAPDALLGVLRKDNYYGLDAAVSYALTRELLVRSEYQYSSNDSNLALYEYDRHVIAVKLRYEFK